MDNPLIVPTLILGIAYLLTPVIHFLMMPLNMWLSQRLYPQPAVPEPTSAPEHVHVWHRVSEQQIVGTSVPTVRRTWQCSCGTTEIREESLVSERVGE